MPITTERLTAELAKARQGAASAQRNLDQAIGAVKAIEYLMSLEEPS